MKKILAAALICIVVLTIGPDGSVGLNHASGREERGDDTLLRQQPSDSRYGPFRTAYDNNSDVPRKAYSAFDRLERREAEQMRAKRAKYRSDRVLVKLRSQSSGGGIKVMASDPTLSILSHVDGLESMERVFPRAKAPSAPSSGVQVMSVGQEEREAEKPDLTRWYRARIRKDRAVDDVLVNLKANPSVEIAEPDYEYKLCGTIPDSTTDPNCAQQWHLDTINAQQAWQHLEDEGLPPGGSSDVIVAVIDTGVDYKHPDLAPNMWVNSREIPGNGIDDDGNGFVDDIHGANVEGSDWDHTGDPMDDNGHGTHCAGIIAAVADNGVGGVGIAYSARIMAVKSAGYAGNIYSSDIAQGIYYAVEHGADVISMSFGGEQQSSLVEDALAVAFGQAVLVAAAGNDAWYNEIPPKVPPPRPFFPASYIYVAGVMAQSPVPNAGGGYLAGFSNYDNHPESRIEYEVMAPGVDIFSTLPLDQYAAWDGTSMACPVVAGMAALLRTKFSDKDMYSSRFIMGQLVSTGPVMRGRIIPDEAGNITPECESIDYHSVDAFAALSDVPTPELFYLEHWLFDTADQSAVNDDDGIVDSGETVDVAIVIRNQWGKAEDVNVILEPLAREGGQPDPFVTMIIGTVNYGAVGTFNWDDNGMIYDDEGAITGVDHPFTFYVDPNTPNNHIIPFLITMTCRNGLDLDDPAIYTFKSRFSLLVQRGRELPSIIEEDMTLTKDDYWIIDQPVLIEEGVTVNVTEGVQIQFWSTEPGAPYSEAFESFLQVEGTLNMVGTPNEPIELFPSDIYPDRWVRIAEAASGTASLQYLVVMNPVIGASDFGRGQSHGNNEDRGSALTAVDHCRFLQWGGVIGEITANGVPPGVSAAKITRSIFYKLGQVKGWNEYDRWWNSPRSFVPCRGDICLIDSCRTSDEGSSARSDQITNTVFLKNYRRVLGPEGEMIQISNVKNWGTIINSDLVSTTGYPVGSYSGNSYFVIRFQDARSLKTVQEFAALLGGNVVTLESEGEDQFMIDYMNANSIYTLNIGLTDYDEEGDLRWIDGSPVSYTGNFTNDNSEDSDFVERWPGGWSWTTGGSERFFIEVAGSITAEEIQDALDDFVPTQFAIGFQNNAILNEWWHPDTLWWMRFFAEFPREWRLYINRNYWGTTSRTLLDAMIYDYKDIFNLAEYVYEPILEEPPETAYPFVVDVVLSTATEPDTTEVGAGDVTFTINFNRDMDPNVRPQVSFGPDVPLTDYTIHPVGGGWQDARTWVGTFRMTPITGDGYQLIRVAGAAAADDPWLVTGDDAGRFRFEIVTSGVEAMNLQATGGEGHVSLAWMQDDFDLLAGFNLYRSTEIEGEYQRINPVIVPAGQTHYRDEDVLPAVTYYYKFTVVKTDMIESSFSNIASAMPLDTIPPVISHTPIITASPNMSLSIAADVTDNYRVGGVTLYYRQIGQTTYQNRSMVHTSGDRYSATLEASLVAAPGLEYYIGATDGISVVFDGTEGMPHIIAIEDKPVVTSVTPNSGPSSGGTDVTIAGSNLKDGASVLFDGIPASGVVWVSESKITCSTPAHFPAMVDVTVVNPEPAGSQGTLLNGFLYVSDEVVVSLPSLTGDQSTTVEIPVSVSNVEGLRAVDATIMFDSSVLSVLSIRAGALTFGWALEANTDTPGSIVISMAHSTAVSGSGVLAYITLQVVGGPASATTLTVDSISLNDGAIPCGHVNGSFVVKELYTVSGDVSYYSGGPVPRTVLSLVEVSSRSYSDVSDATGLFSINNVQTGTYTLTPAKNNDVAEITAYDASLVLQAAAGNRTLSTHETTAADVTRNSQVTSMDASYILEKSVGLREVPFPGAGKVWDFVPENRSYDPLDSDQSGQHFTAILIGDVSGNWRASGGEGATQATRLTAQGSAGAKLILPYVPGKIGSHTVLPLQVELQDVALYSADLAISYDQNNLSVASVSPGSAAEGMMLAVNLQTEGQVRIGLAGAEPLTENGTLVEISFGVLEMSDTPIPVSFLQAKVNEGSINTSIQNGSITTKVSLADFDGDGIVDFSDFAAFASAWLSGAGDSSWNSACDISEPTDSYIDERDIAVLAEDWL